ncbi:hypothetical protein L3X38_033769 [Prunus dulcis]|uniref:Uncharacterized protein n=1 Tax=Prunus dulcis TaxID=3755 RepID=A0AAD4YX43_PRUDU|nr:hypothetical protein L3X38_033769 [Prunus dulcis]
MLRNVIKQISCHHRRPDIAAVAVAGQQPPLATIAGQSPPPAAVAGQSPPPAAGQPLSGQLPPPPLLPPPISGQLVTNSIALY